MTAKSKTGGRLYLGVDVGGTKMLAVLADGRGKVLSRVRCPTPRRCTARETVAAIGDLMELAMAEHGVAAKAVRAAGLAVPGVVDRAAGKVVVTPNMNLSGVRIVPLLGKRLGVPVLLGNDVNLGTLGEMWLGAGRGADSAVGIFVGTGIGGGIVIAGRLLEGFRGAAGEVGHMLVQAGGPRCGCGARGCLEALASRTAIERDIRQAFAAGQKTTLTRLTDRKLAVIKSSKLDKALRARDKLVTRVMRAAADTLARACLSVRHLLDPQIIILGGGVMEACGWFILPIVKKAMAGDPLLRGLGGGKVAASALGDDAVVLGAVALARSAR